MKKTTIIAGLSVVSLVSVGLALFFGIDRTVKKYPAILALKKSCPSSIPLSIRALTTKDKIYVDLSKIGNNQQVITWLAKYDDCMSFPDNYWFTEFAHSIDPVNISESEYKTITLGGIKDELLRTSSIKYDDYKETYDKYLQVNLSPTSLTITANTTYDAALVLYSFPLIESIVMNHGLDSSAAFDFATTTIDGVSTVFLRVRQNENAKDTVGFYDFSNKPPYMDLL
ncbi:hypothetical protein [Flavobacterium sp.]|uniref:hypothetical protein n=1 Tax=Flavobacterium sp. TaxID=239 RepID=UPI004033A4EC